MTEKKVKIIDGRALEFLPDQLKTEEIWDELITEEIWKIAVAQDGYGLQYVPTELLTKEICELAVAETGWALQFVPEELRTYEICKIALSKELYNQNVSKFIPEKIKKLMEKEEIMREIQKLTLKMESL
jgi:hypothetical protein